MGGLRNAGTSGRYIMISIFTFILSITMHSPLVQPRSRLTRGNQYFCSKRADRFHSVLVEEEEGRYVLVLVLVPLLDGHGVSLCGG